MTESIEFPYKTTLPKVKTMLRQIERGLQNGCVW